MSRLESYNGSVPLASGITQYPDEDYALAEAHAIQTQEDGTRLDEELKDIKDVLNSAIKGEIIAEITNDGVLVVKHNPTKQ